MFPSLILKHGANLKSFAQFKRELWIFSHIMTSLPKMMTSSAKMLITVEKIHFHNFFCSEPVKEVPNLYQGKFGAPGPKNAKMKKGGLLGTSRVQQPPKSPCNVGLSVRET